MQQNNLLVVFLDKELQLTKTRAIWSGQRIQRK